MLRKGILSPMYELDPARWQFVEWVVWLQTSTAKQIKQTFSASKHGRSRQSVKAPQLKKFLRERIVNFETDSGLLSLSWAIIMTGFLLVVQDPHLNFIRKYATLWISYTKVNHTLPKKGTTIQNYYRCPWKSGFPLHHPESSSNFEANASKAAKPILRLVPTYWLPTFPKPTTAKTLPTFSRPTSHFLFGTVCQLAVGCFPWTRWATQKALFHSIANWSLLWQAPQSAAALN